VPELSSLLRRLRFKFTPSMSLPYGFVFSIRRGRRGRHERFEGGRFVGLDVSTPSGGHDAEVARFDVIRLFAVSDETRALLDVDSDVTHWGVGGDELAGLEVSKDYPHPFAPQDCRGRESVLSIVPFDIKAGQCHGLALPAGRQPRTTPCMQADMGAVD
jgi:hypothetical protein